MKNLKFLSDNKVNALQVLKMRTYDKLTNTVDFR